MSGSSARISPTAHYTGYVWARNGLSHKELETVEGRLLYESLRGVMEVSTALGGNSLERYLLARHRSIDLLLERAVASGQVSQVVEVACGLSPRGWRFSSRHGSELLYIEADLPGMAARKREALARMGALSGDHRVVELDALAEAGPGSLAGLVESGELDPDRGTAIVTEGLTGYLDGDALAAMWRGFASALNEFPAGVYLSDLHLGEVQDLWIRGFRLVLSAFVRGSVHLHFDDAQAARSALASCGFASVSIRRAADIVAADGGRGEQLVHIIEASTVSD